MTYEFWLKIRKVIHYLNFLVRFIRKIFVKKKIEDFQ